MTMAIMQISQSVSSSIGSAKDVRSSVPLCHSTNPPKIERVADPDPRLASLERSFLVKFSPAALVDASARAA